MQVNSVDLSQKPKTFTNYLIKYIKDIHKKTPDEIIEIIKGAKDVVDISDQYLEKVLDTAEQLKSNKPKLMKYLADIILRGSDLGVITTSNEFMQKLSTIYGSKDELILSIVVKEATRKVSVDQAVLNKAKLVWKSIVNSENKKEEFAQKMKSVLDTVLKSSYFTSMMLNEIRSAVLQATDRQLAIKISPDGDWKIIDSTEVFQPKKVVPQKSYSR
jgi:hypothetical protein